MQELTAIEIRQIQLDILKSVHEFCLSNDIKYSLAFGTLLGGVRHSGYIPWDDDIDIMMPRPDYEKFVKQYVGHNAHHTVQTYKSDDSYYLSFAKVYDNRTELIIFPTKTGVFIDVFPIDGLPSDEAELHRYIKNRLRLIFHNILFTCNNNSYRPGNRFFNLFKYCIKRILYPNRKKYIKQLDELYAKYPFETSSYAGVIIDVFKEKGWMKKSVFTEYTTIMFENLRLNIISDYDTYLSRLYGDYMTLPPEEERVPGHQAKVYCKSL